MGKIRVSLVLVFLMGGVWPFNVIAQQPTVMLQTRININRPGSSGGGNPGLSPLHRNGAAGQLPNVNIIIPPGSPSVSSHQYGMHWTGGSNLQIGQITVQTNNCTVLWSTSTGGNLPRPFPNNGAQTGISGEFIVSLGVLDPGANPSTYSATFTINGAGTTDTLIISGTISRQGGQQAGQQGGGGQQTFQQQWQQLQQQQLGTRIQGRGFTTTLYTRFNPKTGIVEVTKNGVISHRGFLNLQVKDFNRRQALRNYRYR